MYSEDILLPCILFLLSSMDKPLSLALLSASGCRSLAAVRGMDGGFGAAAGQTGGAGAADHA